MVRILVIKVRLGAFAIVVIIHGEDEGTGKVKKAWGRSAMAEGRAAETGKKTEDTKKEERR